LDVLVGGWVFKALPIDMKNTDKDRVQPGTVGMNKLQRRAMGLELGKKVTVELFRAPTEEAGAMATADAADADSAATNTGPAVFSHQVTKVSIEVDSLYQWDASAGAGSSGGVSSSTESLLKEDAIPPATVLAAIRTAIEGHIMQQGQMFRVGVEHPSSGVHTPFLCTITTLHHGAAAEAPSPTVRGKVLAATDVQLTVGKEFPGALRKLGGGACSGLGKVRPGKWHSLSMVVHADQGQIASFVDGYPCSTMTGLSPTDLRLRHKIIILGGAKAAESRGGDVRRVMLHNEMLTVKDIASLCMETANTHKTLGGCALKIQSVYRGECVRKLIREEAAEVARENALAGEGSQGKKKKKKDYSSSEESEDSYNSEDSCNSDY
jgi:hypothetical protein